jgi:hypothetical protein
MNILAQAIALIFLAETERGAVKYDSKGPLQITMVCLDDINRICDLVGNGKHYTPADRVSFDKSFEMAQIYLKWYSKQVQAKTGKAMTAYEMARLWNVGYKGYMRGDGQAYVSMIHRKLALLDKRDAIFAVLKS